MSQKHEVNNSDKELSGPLVGVKVIDLSNFLAAPSASMYLADLGADVTKVEHPYYGDQFRGWGYAKDGIGLYFKIVNRNKKCITADLGTPLGATIAKRLIEGADVVVENYRPGRMEKWGLGYEDLKAINPRIIMLRLTGYGQTGPYSHKPGFGTALEGFAGAAYISGERDGPPLLPAFGLADATSGLMGAFLALAALSERDRGSGEGQVVDLALYEAMFSMLGPFVSDYDQLGIVQERLGSRVPWVAPRNTYMTKDEKWVSISASSDSTFARLCDALGLSALPQDSRFQSNRSRIANVEELDQLLAEKILNITRKDLITIMDENDAVIAPVNSIAEIFQDPHIVDRKNIVQVSDPHLGDISMQNVVGRFSRTPPAVSWTGPSLGEHNREILVEKMGFPEEVLHDRAVTRTTPK